MPVGGDAGATFGDLLERTYRRLMANQREITAFMTADYSVGSDTLTLTGPQATMIMPGSLLAIDQEVFLVQGWTPASGSATGGVAQVIGGYQGSTNADHSMLDVNGFPNRVYIDPRYVRWDIGVAINDALQVLSSVQNGLFQVGVATLTYNPVFMGYDLGQVPANAGWLLEFTYDHPWPDKNFKKVNRWEILRLVDNAKFPSGRGIIMYDGGYPGMTMNLGYGYPFSRLVNVTDGVIVTSGLPPTAIDLPSLMAEVFLTESREIKRNFIEMQADPKTNEEVPAGAMNNALALLNQRIERRIAEERESLYRLYPKRRPLR